MLNKSLTLTLYNLVGRVINFGLFILIANKFGATESTDWFFFNYGLIYLFVGILFNSAEAALVPAWNALAVAHHPYVIRRVGTVAVIGFFLVFPVLLLSCFTLSPLIQLEIPVLPRWQLSAICVFLALQPSLSLLSSLNSSYLQYRQSYLLPTIHLAVRSIGVLAVLSIPWAASVYWLSLAFLVGEVFRLFLLQKEEITSLYKAEIVWPSGNAIRKVLQNCGWMMLALSFTLVNPVIDLAMVGGFGSGGASLVEYAGRLRGLPILAMGGVFVILLGEWSKVHYLSTGLKWHHVKSPFLRLVGFSAALTLILLLSIDWWLPKVFFSSRLSAGLDDLRNLLVYYLLGIPLLAGATVLSRALVVLQEARFLSWVAGLSCLCNVLLNFILLSLLGLPGVALSTTLVDLVGAGALYLFLFSRLNSQS